jgi:hypothetical protein
LSTLWLLVGEVVVMEVAVVLVDLELALDYP